MKENIITGYAALVRASDAEDRGYAPPYVQSLALLSIAASLLEIRKEIGALRSAVEGKR